MRRLAWVVLMLMGTLVNAAEAPASRARTADLTLRYVNDSVISFGDVLQRNQLRLGEYERRGRPRPSTRDELLAFSQQSLNDLTDEELLIQYGHQLAEERGFQLVDHERISQQVMERARASGRGRSLREQAEERRYIERQQIIDLVTGYFESRIPHISPQDIERSYKEREQEFRRPARAKVYQIVLRPSSPGERQEIRLARVKIFKEAQDVTDATIRTISESRIEAYTVATPETQERLLAEAVQEIARQAERADLDAAARALVKNAAEVEARAAALRDVEATRKELEVLRADLLGKDLAAFAETAKRVSQGPGAADGGLLGWVEPGSYQPAFDEVVFSIKPGELSPVFMADKLACLVVVSERSEASSRAFGEVVGEIESALRRAQNRAAREATVLMLRTKASIRDLITIPQLLD
jgi:parvulin-like peptidyl-prolyl isomerase